MTKAIREILKLKKGEPFPTLEFLYKYMSGIYTGQFIYLVVEDKMLKNNYAETDIKNRIVRIRQSVFDSAAENDENALKIIKHEIGHCLLHTNDVELIFAKSEKDIKIKKIEDPEWQADIFVEYL